MKFTLKRKLTFLLILGFSFGVSGIINDTNYIGSVYRGNDTLNFEYLEISTISGKIHIIGNSGWVDFRNAGNCTGSGTYSDPYVIENLVTNGILIENSSVYFKIENCVVHNSYWRYGGILLVDVNNSQLINNDSSSHHKGISLLLSNNNTISGNFLNNNYQGIDLWYSNNNVVSGNSANNNSYGIFLERSNCSIISGNNFIGNDVCIKETDCEGNIFENNICRGESRIPGYNLLFLFTILIGVIMLIKKKAMKHALKRK